MALRRERMEAWPREWAAEIGRAVQRTRKAQGLSAAKLSELCAESGFPIPRNTIANLENGRKETVPIHEVVILARALNVAPIDLLFPLVDRTSDSPLGSAEPKQRPELSQRLAGIRRFIMGPRRAPGMSSDYAVYNRHEWLAVDVKRQQEREGQTDGVARLAAELAQFRFRMEAAGYPLPELPDEVQWWMEEDEAGYPNYQVDRPDDPLREPPSWLSEAPDPEEPG